MFNVGLVPERKFFETNQPNGKLYNQIKNYMNS